MNNHKTYKLYYNGERITNVEQAYNFLPIQNTMYQCLYESVKHGTVLESVFCPSDYDTELELIPTQTTI